MSNKPIHVALIFKLYELGPKFSLDKRTKLHIVKIPERNELLFYFTYILAQDSDNTIFVSLFVKLKCVNKIYLFTLL